MTPTLLSLTRVLLPTVLLLLSGAAAATADCETPTKLRVSIIPAGDLQKDLAGHQPLLDELQAALSIPVEVYSPPSYGAVVEGLLSGAVHLARLGPASYVSAKKADPYITAFASFEHKANTYQAAGAFYYSLLVVRADSGINDAAAVRGKRLVLVDPESTSGALIPRRLFSRQVGKTLESWFGKIGYSGSHVQSINRVLAGQADAAFIGSVNLAAALPEAKAQQQVKVIWRSTAFPLDAFVYRGQLCDGLKKKIRAVFLNADGARQSATLKNLGGVRFVPISDGDYQPVRDIY